MARKPQDARSQVLNVLTGKKRRRKSRAKLKPFQRLKRKLYRSAVAALKKKGVIPRTVDARKVVPSAALSKTINRNQDVLSGRAKTYRLPPETTAKQLKQYERLGYRVERKGEHIKLVTPKTQYVRKGQIYTKPSTSRRGARLEHINLGVDMEQQIREAFEGLKPGEFVAFQVNGHNSYSIYGSPESMIRDLMAYRERDFLFTTLVVFRISKANQAPYIADSAKRRKEREQGSPQARAKRNLRRRERRAFLKGMRVSRGH